MFKRRVFITGMGAISSIGLNVKENFHSLASEKSGIKKGVNPHTSSYFVGEIPFTNQDLIEKFHLKNQLSRTSILACIAAKEAFANQIDQKEIKTGVIASTSVGGMDVSEVEYHKFLNNQPFNKDFFSHHSSGNLSEIIAKELNIKPLFLNTISTACSSSANAIMMGVRMIQFGLLDRVVVGGADALTTFTINGFRSLMIFDNEWCKPFDESRKGLNLGEGAGFLVLETRESREKTKKSALAEITGWSNVSDAYHQTASSPDGYGASLAMKEALKVAGFQSNEIQYINAHGTATPNNDLSESKAIINVFNKIPLFSSTKAYTGHTLAAAGGLEAIFSVLATQNNCVFANLNFNNPIEETGLVPVNKSKEVKEIKNVLSNSFGFGGNNSTLIISKY